MKKIIFAIVSIFLLAGCNADRVALKVGDIEVKNGYVDYFAQSFNTQSGGTVSDAVRKKAFHQAQIYAQMIELCNKMSLDTNSYYEANIKNIEKQYNGLDKYKEKQKIDDGLFEFVMKGDASRQTLFEEYKKDSGITPEKETAYFKENFWRAKHLLLLTEGKDESEKKQIKSQIDELYKRVKSGEDFEDLIKEYNEDPGVQSNPNGYVFTVGEMVPEFQNAVAESEVGEYRLIETSYGYHIVKRLALDESDMLFEKLKQDKLSAIDSGIITDEYFRNYFWRAKHILFLTQGKSSAEKEKLKSKALEVFEQAKEGEDFDKLISQYNEDPGVAGAPDGYVFTDKEMVSEFQNAVSGIGVGEFNIAESDFGFHVILRLPLDETPELYRKFKTENMQKLVNIDGADINNGFSDYIIRKVDEFDIETRDFTGLSEKTDKY